MSDSVNSNNRVCPDCKKPFYSLLYEQYKKDKNKEPRSDKKYRCLNCKQHKERKHNNKHNKRPHLEETGYSLLHYTYIHR